MEPSHATFTLKMITYHLLNEQGGKCRNVTVEKKKEKRNTHHPKEALKSPPGHCICLRSFRAKSGANEKAFNFGSASRLNFEFGRQHDLLMQGTKCGGSTLILSTL